MLLFSHMRQSQLFTKTQKNAPKDEVSLNAQLLIRAGFVDKLMAGVYTYLPLGWRVMEKIKDIIRKEINNIGGQEILMPSLQPRDLWKETDMLPEDKEGWGRMREVMYQLKDKSGRDIGFGCTHEEVATDIGRKFITSYKDLPVAFYQFQNKFRQELRAKSGVIRGREFLMKDLYSFHRNEEDADKYYFQVAESYKKIFELVGLKAMMVEASGGSFTKNYSHEFQVVSEAGEDRIVYCEKCDFAQSAEIFNVEITKKCPKCANDIKINKSIEVGNIFRFYDKYAKEMKMQYTDEKGDRQSVYLCSYGIGIGRLMGTIVEVFHDEKGIIWPESVAPFAVHLINLGQKEEAEKIYQELSDKNIEVLFDDREVSAGEKFADADLIGIPLRVVVSQKSLEKGGVEVKERKEEKAEIFKIKELLKKLEK